MQIWGRVCLRGGSVFYMVNRGECILEQLVEQYAFGNEIAEHFIEQPGVPVDTVAGHQSALVRECGCSVGSRGHGTRVVRTGQNQGLQSSSEMIAELNECVHQSDGHEGPMGQCLTVDHGVARGRHIVHHQCASARQWGVHSVADVRSHRQDAVQRSALTHSVLAILVDEQILANLDVFCKFSLIRSDSLGGCIAVVGHVEQMGRRHCNGATRFRLKPVVQSTHIRIAIQEHENFTVL